MIELSAELLNDTSVNRLLKIMPDRINDVIVVSLNKAISAYRSETKKKTPKEWDAPKNEFADFKVKRANKRGEMSAAAILRGKRISLYRMSANPRSVMGGKTTGGVSILIAGTRHSLKSAFVANMKGNIGVFERIGKRRKDVARLDTSAVSQMVSSEKTKLLPKFSEKAQQVFNDTFISECNSWLVAMGAK